MRNRHRAMRLSASLTLATAVVFAGMGAAGAAPVGYSCNIPGIGPVPLDLEMSIVPDTTEATEDVAFGVTTTIGLPDIGSILPGAAGTLNGANIVVPIPSFLELTPGSEQLNPPAGSTVTYDSSAHALVITVTSVTFPPTPTVPVLTYEVTARTGTFGETASFVAPALSVSQVVLTAPLPLTLDNVSCSIPDGTVVLANVGVGFEAPPPPPPPVAPEIPTEVLAEVAEASGTGGSGSTPGDAPAAEAVSAQPTFTG